MSFSSSTVSHPFVDPGGDAWKNGLSPGNFHCLDPSFDSKGQNLTPKKAKIDPMGKSLCGRLCRSLWPWVGAGFRRLPFHLLFFHTPSAAHLWPFSTGLTRAQIRALGAWVGFFPYPGEKPSTTGHTGRNRRVLGSLLGTKNRCRVLPGSGPVSLLWGLLEFFRFFFILRPEEVFLPQIIRLLLGDVPPPLVGVDRAIQFICQAI